jgi:hypothetical protein
LTDRRPPRLADKNPRKTSEVWERAWCRQGDGVGVYSKYRHKEGVG